MKIDKINAQQILDSRGNPTLRVQVFTQGVSSEFAVPSGASTGSHEAKEKRDGDLNFFAGLGVKQAIQIINDQIAPALVGTTIEDQAQIDKILLELDGTADKSNLGGNSLIGVSIACAKAAAKALNLEVFQYLKSLAAIPPSRPTPYLLMNLINGGKHSHSHLAFQEYQIIPQTTDIEQALNMGTKILTELKEIITKKLGPLSTNIGDEGGLVPDISDPTAPLEYLTEAINNCNYQNQVKLGLDLAASSFYQAGSYKINDQLLSPQQLLEYYLKLLKKYPILLMEDPFYEEGFGDFAQLLGQIDYLIGDDLTTTNKERLQKALDQKSINAIIIKPNQIGTLTETLATMKLARENGIEGIISHRSGETNDDFIADLAVAFGCFGLKAGAPQRGERVAKYNRLLTILR